MKSKRVLTYLFLIALGIIMVYPLLFMFFAPFKSNDEILTSISLLPESFSELGLSAYINGWKAAGDETFGVFFKNSFMMVVPTVIFTVLSSSLVAYGFARFKFPFKRILFTLMISAIMLPKTVIIIPSYLLFKDFGWLDTYLPFIVPALFACNSYFIFLFVQFFRGLPKELDEAAIIDGCNVFRVYTKIILPLSKPAMMSAGIFSFIWTYNDFFNSLIYLNSVSKYTVSLGLKMSIDTQGGTIAWNEIMAMSVLAIIPPTMIFFLAQKYFVEGISTSGLKG
ncbi:carbohydrate ABC transporter permease [Vallitalea okinawensis]|uniref:carbohydrate ABC transporter permease n=1 Tax=Vallitalea okinawensis TaxID=2078660 RepID=UPI000CFAF749|nr:carbohydrate ABC transporter permease [Vallitalea okinawensis]